MPAKKEKLTEIKKMFKEISKLSNNFTIFDSNIILKKPSRLTIYRMCMKAGMTQKEFSKLINKKASLISYFETTNKISRKTADNLMKSIRKFFIEFKLVNNPSQIWENIKISYYRSKSGIWFGKSKEEKSEINRNRFFKVPIKRRLEIAKLGGDAVKKLNREIFKEFGSKGGKKRWVSIPPIERSRIMSEITRKGLLTIKRKYGEDFFRQLGKQTMNKFSKEKRIELGHLGEKAKEMTIQEKKIEKCLKTNKIAFESKARLDTKDESFNIDFVVPNSSNPRIIIEATSLVHHDAFYINSVELSNKSQLIKNTIPQINTIAIISKKLPPEGVQKLNNSFDSVYTDEELNKLYKNIRTILKGKIQYHKLSINPKICPNAKRKPTKQELRVKELIENLKVPYKYQMWVVSNNSRRLVDFIIDYKNPIIIEATYIKKNNEKSINKSVRRLVNKLLMIKDIYVPNAILIGLIESDSGKIEHLHSRSNYYLSLGKINLVKSIDELNGFLKRFPLI